MTKNTNYLVYYVHIKKKHNWNKIVFKLLEWPKTPATVKKENYQMTSKNSNYPNDLLKTEHFSSPIEPLVICLKPLFNRNFNQKENYQMTWKNSNYSNDPLKNGHISSPIEPYLLTYYKKIEIYNWQNLLVESLTRWNLFLFAKNLVLCLFVYPICNIFTSLCACYAPILLSSHLGTMGILSFYG